MGIPLFHLLEHQKLLHHNALEDEMGAELVEDKTQGNRLNREEPMLPAVIYPKKKPTRYEMVDLLVQLCILERSSAI